MNLIHWKDDDSKHHPGYVVDLHGELVLLNNEEINEAFDRGVMGVLEFDGRDVPAVGEGELLVTIDRFSLVDGVV